MNKQSIAESVIYDSVSTFRDRNDALVFVREQSARIAELETALQNLYDIATIAEYYLPGELAENPHKVREYIEKARALLAKKGGA